MTAGNHVDDQTVSVLVVDDHPIVRRGLVALLGSLPAMSVVGEAGDGADAVRLAAELRPDVVVMDIAMPGTDGLTATRAILDAVPGTAVLVLTMFDDDDSLVAALRAGARGYALKDGSHDDLVRAVRAVARGDAVFGRSVAPRALRLLAAGSQEPTAASLPQLTRREREILDLLAQGLRTHAIAERLHLSAKTVSNNLSSVFAKLEVTDRTEAVLRAREAGLGRGDQGPSATGRP